MATTVVVPPPAPGPRCEAVLEHGALSPVESAGGQRFVQRAVGRGSQGTWTGFAFIDCGSGEGVGIVESPRAAGTPDPYVIRRDTDVERLVALARHRGDAADRFAGPPDVAALINPFCGCKVLYPGSVGAQYGN